MVALRTKCRKQSEKLKVRKATTWKLAIPRVFRGLSNRLREKSCVHRNTVSKVKIRK